MKALLLPLMFIPTILSADPAPQTVQFTSVSPDRDYALFVVAAPSDCPATRFLALGDGVQAVSAALLAGQSAVLPLGRAFSPGAHQVQISALGCDAGIESLRLVVLNQPSPGHGRAVILSGTAPAN